MKFSYFARRPIKGIRQVTRITFNLNHNLKMKKTLPLLLILAIWSFFSVQQVRAQNSTSATYNVTFTSNWSTAAHPNRNFPSNDHWSPLVGATHTEGVHYWSRGGMATTGFKNIAETGAHTRFRSEVEQSIQSGAANQYINGGPLATGLGNISITSLEVDADFPLLTLISMIAPSPDWVIAVDGISLLDDDGKWVVSQTIDLYPYDAGTDSGTEYGSPNQVTNPQASIGSLKGQYPFSDEKIGTLTIQLVTADIDARFEADVKEIEEGGEVSFSFSGNSLPSAYEWEFEGGMPATSTEKNPVVRYDVPGTYNVKLTTIGASGEIASADMGDYITVNSVSNCSGPIPSITLSKTDETAPKLNDGSLVLNIEDTPGRVALRISLNGGQTYPFRTKDNVGTFTIDGRKPRTYDVWALWGDRTCPTPIGMITVDAAPSCEGTAFPSAMVSSPQSGHIKFTFPDVMGRGKISFSTDGGSTYPHSTRDNRGSLTVRGLSAGQYDLWVRWGNGDCPTDLGTFDLGTSSASKQGIPLDLPEEIKLYPNPFVTGIRLSPNKALEGSEVAIFDMLGQLLEVKKYTGEPMLMGENLPSSAQYILKISSENAVKTYAIQKR